MEKGWKATGLLAPLWRRYGGGRDALAVSVGTKPNVLSSINTGKRPLGYSLASRLAAELEVSVLELGAPETMADQVGAGLLDRLEELEGEVSRLTSALETAGKAHDRLLRRVLALERHTGLRSRARRAELSTRALPSRQGTAAR